MAEERSIMASKEDCEAALGFLVSAKATMPQVAYTFIRAFLMAAHRRLPYTETLVRDEERRKGRGGRGVKKGGAG